jgi:hypothetical protein
MKPVEEFVQRINLAAILRIICRGIKTKTVRAGASL